VYAFLSGVLMMACATAAALFFRYWRQTLDRLFLWFAISFSLLGIERIVNFRPLTGDLAHPAVYLLRFVAFLLIIIAIVDKNRRT
jgi:hypothetical protein